MAHRSGRRKRHDIPKDRGAHLLSLGGSFTGPVTRHGPPLPSGSEADCHLNTNLSELEPSSSTYYNWFPEPSDDAHNLSVEFVPMLWGTDQIEIFSTTIDDTRSSLNVTTILGMNECSNLTAVEGANMWKQHLEPVKSRRNVRLGSSIRFSSPPYPSARENKCVTEA
ncbi:glycosyl hydrolase catalytic core-domain-containing protein [Mycena leptocephala]|nr:glycosyl hydrolase catalytic core-domain-containing protein [Mycena leptocephala]